MALDDIQKAQLLLDVIQHPGFILLRELSEGLNFQPDETLKGHALREDIYYKACQREGIQKFFRLLDCQLFVMQERLKGSKHEPRTT